MIGFISGNLLGEILHLLPVSTFLSDSQTNTAQFRCITAIYVASIILHDIILMHLNVDKTRAYFYSLTRLTGGQPCPLMHMRALTHLNVRLICGGYLTGKGNMYVGMVEVRAKRATMVCYQ